MPSLADEIDGIQTRRAGTLARGEKIQHPFNERGIYDEPGRSGLVVRVRNRRRLHYLGVYENVKQARDARDAFIVRRILPDRSDLADALRWAISLGKARGTSLAAIQADLPKTVNRGPLGLDMVLLGLLSLGEVVRLRSTDDRGKVRERYALNPQRPDVWEAARDFGERLARKRRAEFVERVFHKVAGGRGKWNREVTIVARFGPGDADEVRAVLLDLEAAGRVRRHVEGGVTWWQAVRPLEAKLCD
jgi:hypothetical protein